MDFICLQLGHEVSGLSGDLLVVVGEIRARVLIAASASIILFTGFILLVFRLPSILAIAQVMIFFDVAPR